MPITVKETRGVTGDSASAERRFFINGTLSLVDARAALIDKLTADDELTYAGLPYKDCKLDEDIRMAWRARVLYAATQSSGGGGGALDSMGFDTTGATRKVTIGQDERRTTGAPNARNLVAINGDGEVEGVEAVARIFNFERKKTIPADQVTTAYIGALFYGTGTINNAAFDDGAYLTNEVLFRGVRGQKARYGPWEMEFHFSARPTPFAGSTVGRVIVPGLSGDLTLNGVNAWDAVWTKNFPRKITWNSINMVIPVPEAIYANRIYEQSNFNLLNAL